MIILISGINGFVGKNLVNSLCKHTIYGISNNFTKNNAINQIYLWHEINKLTSIDVVIHLAGKAHDTENRSKAQEYFDVNTALTQIIFDWFLKSEAKKFIFFSSVKAVTDDIQGILTEDVIPNPGTPYGESKLKAEEYVKKSWDYAVNELNKQIYILRPCMIHGSGNKGNLNLLYKMVRKGIPWLLGAFNNQRSFISIDNVSYIISQLIEQDIASGIYNLADDEPLSTNEVIQIMCDVMSCKCKILHINKKLMTNIAILGDILPFPLNQERLKKLTQDFVVSNEKIKKALSVDSLPLTAKEGLIKTISSFK